MTYLRNVNETVDSLLNLYKCSERNDSNNLSVNNVAYSILFSCKIPRLGLELLVAYRNFLVLFIYLQNKEVIRLAYL